MVVDGMMLFVRTEGIKTVEVSGGMQVGVEGGGVLDIWREIGFVDVLLGGGDRQSKWESKQMAGVPTCSNMI